MQVEVGRQADPPILRATRNRLLAGQGDTDKKFTPSHPLSCSPPTSPTRPTSTPNRTHLKPTHAISSTSDAALGEHHLTDALMLHKELVEGVQPIRQAVALELDLDERLKQSSREGW